MARRKLIILTRSEIELNGNKRILLNIYEMSAANIFSIYVYFLYFSKLSIIVECPITTPSL